MEKSLILLISTPLLFLSCLVTTNHPVLNIAVPSEWQDEAVEILSDSIELELKEAGRMNNLYEKQVTWYKINNTATNELKTSKIYDWECYEYPPAIEVVVIYKNGSSKNVADFMRRKLTEKVYEYDLSRHASNGYLTIVNIPDYSNVTGIRICVQRRYKRCELYDHVLLRENYSIVAKRITFSYPVKYDIKFGLENRENLSVKTDQKEFNGEKVYIIECENIPKLPEDFNQKYPESWYAALFMSLPPVGNKSYSWQQLGDFDLKKIADSIGNKKKDFLDSIARTIKASDEDQKIDKAFCFVKDNIRYYGNWEKDYGLIPRDPLVVFKQGYGDCKEMATFLTLLLRKLQVKAWQTNVNSQEVFQYLEQYPLLRFNHMIVCVQKSNGQLFYLDPTNKISTAASSYHYLIGKKVLILKNGTSMIDTIRPDPSYTNKIITHSDILPPGHGSGWLIKGSAEFLGDIARQIYEELKTSENLEQSTVMRNILKELLQIQAADVSLKECDPEHILIAFAAGFSQCILETPAKGLVFSIPVLYTPKTSYSDLSYEGDRYLSRIEQTDIWKIPEEYREHEFSQLKTLFAQGSWNLEKNTLTRNYRCDFVYIDVSQRETLKQFFTERNTFARGIAWSKK